MILLPVEDNHAVQNFDRIKIMTERFYGTAPYSVVVVHGGPGAPGEMMPVAKELSKSFGVIEQIQTADSVAGQVAELKQVIEEKADSPIVLVGWSWGAWLALITTSRNPELVRKLILVSSGPFEQRYAEGIMTTRLSRLENDEKLRTEDILGRLNNGEKVSGDEFSAFGELMSKTDSYDPLPNDNSNSLPPNPEIYEKVWKEAEELRKSGKLLESAANIKCPVIVIHGDYDPHPFEGVQEPLSKVLKDVKFVTLTNCGHTPWQEKQAKGKFFKILTEEIQSG